MGVSEPGCACMGVSEQGQDAACGTPPGMTWDAVAQRRGGPDVTCGLQEWYNRGKGVYEFKTSTVTVLASSYDHGNVGCGFGTLQL
mmetsp:Transcript_21361/g.46705  ORF Transcript_21361/g.46705 Transcript_21361/m.46705 type:complete len:86 (+) Transcript_21361:1577-1834(+)